MVDDDSALHEMKRATLNPEPFLNARPFKDAKEIRRITEASQGLDRVFEAIQAELRPGRSEWSVATEVMKLATEKGLTPSGSDSALSPIIVAFGANGALPHSELTGRKLKPGDYVVVDIFFRFEGYNSDSTRTFAIGSVSADMKKSYTAVREAQEGALELAREGTACGDVNEATVKVLRRHGVEKYLPHGVGIDIRELPSVSKGNATRLERNDVISDEPGVYFPGKYGVRIEDTLVVGPKPMVLTKFTKDLVTCG